MMKKQKTYHTKKTRFFKKINLEKIEKININ